MAVVLGHHLPPAQPYTCTDKIVLPMSGKSDAWFTTPSEIHVLLVDDERLSRVVVGNLLKKCNYQVTIAESGAEALQVLRGAKPDTFQLILTDVMMPDVSGLDLLRFIRSTDHLKNLPVVMMSANEHRETVFQCISGGAEEFLVKPVTKKEVQNIWQHVWRKLANVTASISAPPTDCQEDAAAPNARTPSTNPGTSAPHGSPAAVMAAPPQPEAAAAPSTAATCEQQDAQQSITGKRRAPLTQWMLRPGRQVDVRDSFRVLCELLLMLERLASSKSTPAHGVVRPSQVLLHATGKVTLAREEQPGEQADGEEESLYRSPEEAAGAPATERSDTFSLGILMFELCQPVGKQRAQVLSSVRARLLPQRFVDSHPQEAQFILTLLHPDPLQRPTPAELMQWDSLRQMCEVLRLRHLQEDQAEAVQQLAMQQHLAAEDEALLDFLALMRSTKQTAASTLQAELGCLEQDIGEVERRLSVLRGTDLTASASFWVEPEPPSGSARKRRRLGVTAKAEAEQEALTNAREQKITTLFSHLEALYYERLRQHQKQPHAASHKQPQAPGLKHKAGEVASIARTMSRGQDAKHQSGDGPSCSSITVKSESSGTSKRAVCSADSSELPGHLSSLSEDLLRITQYRQFEVRASLRYGDLLSSTNMVCSMAFDRDDEYFATAGVSKRIKIFDYGKVVDPNTSLPMQYPVLEINSRSKLSGVCWSSYIKGHLACSDYEGVVQLWDAHVNSELMQFEEHARRVWSVDLSRLDPLRLLSGSDDGLVKLWSMNQEHSVCNIDSHANVCSVQFSPESPHLIAFGSANYRVYLYDLRHTAAPLVALPGHTKAVSYVRFMEGGRLVSASTDNTLRLWNIAAATAGGDLSADSCHEMTFSGHVNEKNFVGLSVTDSGYIACGSETNSVHCYYRSLPTPLLSYALSSEDHVAGIDGDMMEGGQFVSSVCWSKKNNALLAANSAGIIRVLGMA